MKQGSVACPTSQSLAVVLTNSPDNRLVPRPSPRRAAIPGWKARVVPDHSNLNHGVYSYLARRSSTPTINVWSAVTGRFSQYQPSSINVLFLGAGGQVSRAHEEDLADDPYKNIKV